MVDEHLWSGLGLVGPLDARVSGRPPEGVLGISIDTRTLAPGDLFVALKGDQSDGHAHVRAAFEKGAAAAVVDEDHFSELLGAGALYVVKDTLRALEGLARAARARAKARIVAITGSVGKTSAKDALKLVLSDIGPTHGAQDSYNNHWGVPLTLARMPATSRYGVFEIGMNHPGEIRPLAAMTHPHVAVITTIAPVHLEHMVSLENIAREKSEIFSGVSKGGAAILPRDDAQFPLLFEIAAASPAGFVLSYGADQDADARLLDIAREGKGSRVKAQILGQDVDYLLGAPGLHQARNSVAVLLAARALGADIVQAAGSLEKFTASKGRGRRLQLQAADGPFVLIDESYNANPVSMRAALDLLGAAEGKRKIAAIGDMLELGPNAREMHIDLAQDILRNQIDLVFAVGPMSQALYESLPVEMRAGWADRSIDIESALLDCPRAGDAIMIKGSLGSRMGPLVAKLSEKFSIDDAAFP